MADFWKINLFGDVSMVEAIFFKQMNLKIERTKL